MKEQIERFIHFISMEYDSGISIVYENHEIEDFYIELNIVIEIDNKEYTNNIRFSNYKNHIDFNEIYEKIAYIINSKIVESRKSL